MYSVQKPVDLLIYLAMTKIKLKFSQKQVQFSVDMLTDSSYYPTNNKV